MAGAAFAAAARSLLGQGPLAGDELRQGLALTGHFLNRGLQAVLFDRPLPEARARLIEMLTPPQPRSVK